MQDLASHASQAAQVSDPLSQAALSECVPWSRYAGKTVVISGITGLIGSVFARVLLCRNRLTSDDIQIIGLVRDMEKAQNRFPSGGITFVKWDALGDATPNLSKVDYLIHCASPTKGAFFLGHPAETIMTGLLGTRSLLELARCCGSRFCYVSSMEVYGVGSSEPLRETAGGAFDSLAVRSCYPETKRACEALCSAYAAEFKVGATVARLAQSFGWGVPKTESRVFAQFARAIIKNEDIELATDGLKENMYVSTLDAATALLAICALGEPGNAYNVANETTLCSVRQMAERIVEWYGCGQTVKTNTDPEAAGKYPESGRIALDTSKLRALGWEPMWELKNMYGQLIDGWSRS